MKPEVGHKREKFHVKAAEKIIYAVIGNRFDLSVSL